MRLVLAAVIALLAVPAHAKVQCDDRYLWTCDVRTPTQLYGVNKKRAPIVKPRIKQARKKTPAQSRAGARQATAAEPATSATSNVSNPSISSPLIVTARRYLGGNPTGWRRLWCGKFMELVVREVGGAVPRFPALAMSWASLPRTQPRVGAIAVLKRRGGGHVGVVVGWRGHNPVILSGNHGRRVGIGVYSRSRVVAWVET